MIEPDRVQMAAQSFDKAQAETVCPHPVGEWLAAAVESEASDLHIVAGYPPVLRVHGVLKSLPDEPLDGELTRDLLTRLCPPEALDRFLLDQNVDFSFELVFAERARRFRGNLFFNGGEMGACFRLIPAEIPDFEWAGFPPEIAGKLARVRSGLVRISGVAGSGKSTTLAMIINLLNQEGGRRIITVEEPVEYVFPRCPGSVISQREVGVDVQSFADGLKYGLRQDPDVILVGEIRDRETAQMALTAAETGHVVYSTVHTRDAKGAVSRYTDLFPHDVQGDIRSQLALGLRAVISQHLLPSSSPDQKRELALEIMLSNAPIANAIRTGKLQSIDNCILTGREAGMIALDESIRRMLDVGRITRQTADRFVSDPSVLD